MKRWILRTAALLAVVTATFVVLYFWPDARIVVSPETTYLTEPLDAEGRVDYLAAINHRAAEGVTPENNAAVLYWQALGPGLLESEHYEEFFERLGMEPLPIQGKYFKPLDDIEEKEALEDLDDLAKWNLKSRLERREARRESMRRIPWVRDEDPFVAQWLEDNRQPLDLFVTGTLRPRHFVPKLASLDEAGEEFLYGGMGCRDYGDEFRKIPRALMQRAMLRSGRQQHEAAWNDCLACFRLARHTATEQSLVGALVSYSYVFLATPGVPALLHEGDFVAHDLMKMRDEFREVATCASVAEAIDWGERLMVLDATYGQSRGLRDLRGSIDWNQVLREWNKFFDRVVAAMKSGAGEPEVESLNEEFELLFTTKKGIPWRLAAYPFNRPARSRIFGTFMRGFLWPPMASVVDVELACKARLDRVEIFFALALYREKHREYPADLAALVPAFLDKIPLDPRDGQPTRYRKQDDGYWLWGVGHNRRDDGGRTEKDWDDDANSGDDPWDDDVFRVPQRLKPITDETEDAAENDESDDENNDDAKLLDDPPAATE